jgi:hypothetical protein
MLIQYFQEALEHAHYEMIDDEEPYYGEIPEMSTEDLIEFLQDTEPDWYVAPSEKMMLSPKALKNQLFCHIWGEKLSLSTGLNLRYFLFLIVSG